MFAMLARSIRLDLPAPDPNGLTLTHVVVRDMGEQSPSGGVEYGVDSGHR